MASHEDVEVGSDAQQGELAQPLVQGKKVSGAADNSHGNGSIWVVLLSTFVAVCGSFEFGSCVGYSAPTEAAIIQELHLSLAEFSLFGAILNIGAMIGAVTSGRIADLTGRKWTMRISAVICIAAWIIVFYSEAAWSLDVGRFFMGYGIGVVSYVVPVFIAEITPKNIRGGLTAINQLMICCGASFGFIVGTLVSWRILALTGIVPCIILILGLFFIPESPRWLAKVGREKEFEDALQRLRGKDADISEEAVEIREYIESLENLPKAGIRDIFQKRYARSIIVGVGLIALQQFGGINGYAFYISQIFVNAGFSSGSMGTIAYACLQIPLTALGAVITDKSGRRPLLLISATGTFIGCFLTGLSFYIKVWVARVASHLQLGDHVEIPTMMGNTEISSIRKTLNDRMLSMEHYAALTWSPFLALTGVLIYVGSFSLGIGAIPWIIMSEIFPINIKGIAGSMVTLMHWIGALVVSYTFNFLILWSSSGTFFLYAGVCAATILFIVKLVPETKGRTLEDIQASMSS